MTRRKSTKWDAYLADRMNDSFRERFENSEQIRPPLPRGGYVCSINSTKPLANWIGDIQFTGVQLELQVVIGGHKHRRFGADLWLTPASFINTKRQLARLGIKTAEQVIAPDHSQLNKLRLYVVVVVRKDKFGRVWNEVKEMEVIA